MLSAILLMTCSSISNALKIDSRSPQSPRMLFL
jgi:hypothetical protein